MKPSIVSLEGEQDAYGPAMLSVMEYTARMYGVHMEREQIYWGVYSGMECEYEQELGDNLYLIKNDGKSAVGYVNGKQMFKVPKDVKVITDVEGSVIKVVSLSGTLPYEK